MTNPVLNVLVMALYLSVGALLWHALRRGTAPAGPARLAWLTLGAGALLLHAAILYGDLFRAGGLSLGFTNAVSLVAWAVVIVFLMAALYKPVEPLGAFIMPLAAVTVLLAWAWPPGNTPLAPASPIQSAHIVISLLAYSLLSVAVMQSLMLLAQERHLHSRRPSGLLRALPSLEVMEDLMFQMITAGFLLLTLTLISGVFFSEQVFGKPLRFTHHIVLSLFAWLVFAILLLGRRLYGWRGRPAVLWTLAGFSLLLLGYFGSKFVLEVLLHRTS